MALPTPLRSDDEVVGAYVPITLGGKKYQLPELPRKANREWQSLLTDEVRKTLTAVGPLDTADEVIDAIADSAELMMDLLIAYDQAGAKAWSEVRGTPLEPVLPERDWIDTHATDRECYESIKAVMQVAFPTGADLLRLVPELRPMLLQAFSRGVAAATVAMVSSRSMSSAPPSTDGSQTTLSAA